MKRSVGLTLVGVLVILLSALAFLLDTLGVVGLQMIPKSSFPPPTVPGQPDPRIVVLPVMAFVLLVSGFGVFNGVGLIKRWNWSRYVTIVFGFLAAGMSAISALVMAMFPFPVPPGPGNDRFALYFRLGITGFYLFWTILFTAISFFLLRKRIAEEFRGSTPEPSHIAGVVLETSTSTQEPRPILVWIVAGLLLAAICAIPMMFFMKTPMMFMGILLPGAAGRIVFTIWSLASVAIGTALFLRVRRALWFAIGLYLFGTLNSVFLFFPGPYNHFLNALSTTVTVPNPHFFAGIMRMSLFVGTLSAVIPILLLLIGRQRYFEWCNRPAQQI